jgi:phage-related protein
LHIDFRKVIAAKVVSLSEHGLELLSTKVLERIQGDDHNFYELRGGRCRIAVYFDELARRFVLLHGFIKTRDNERREISRARDLLHEYLHIS